MEMTHMACKKSAQCACKMTAKKSVKVAATAKLPTQNAKLIAWVNEIKKLCQPKDVVWCDGSKAEYDAMIKITVDAGAAIPLKKRPNSVLFRITKYGQAAIVGEGYASDMPGFESVLSDAEIYAVLAIIRSTWADREREF